MANQNDNDTSLSWQAPEFQDYPKNLGWYITLIIIAGLIVVYQILQRDLFGAFTVVVLALFVLAFSRQKPRLINIKFTNKGLRLDDNFIPYQEIKHFWIVDNERHKTVNLETTAYLHHMAILQLAGQDPDEVRDFLLDYLLEHEATQETFAQRLMHLFRL